MMQLEQAKSHVQAANKLALEAEKERDASEKAVEELECTHSSKAVEELECTHSDDVGDAHEMLAEVDNWDLRDQVAQDGMGRIWLSWSWERSVGWPRSHDKFKSDCRHHAR